MVLSVARKANENPENFLFHYTTAQGLFGIVSDGFVRATHHRFLNDKSELNYGFMEFSRIASCVLDEQLSDTNSRIRALAQRGFVFDGSAKAWAVAVEHLIVSAFGCYLFCLCSHTQKNSFEHGLLSQWRGYGNDGGYAIRFKRDRLSEYFAQIDAPLNVKLEPVIYGINPTSRTISEGLKTSMAQKLLTWCENPFTHKEDVNISDFIDIGFVGEILDYVVFTKNEHFGEENEWRLCAILQGTTAPNAEKYWVRGGTIVPYVEVRSKVNIRDCIDQVIVGPHADQDERCRSTHHFLRSRGCEALVVPTNIPLRAS